MPNVKGVILTDRDRALLAYIGIARYASADQVHRLIAPGMRRPPPSAANAIAAHASHG